MVGFAVVVGIAAASPGAILSVPIRVIAFGFLTGFSISSFSMITNDVYDYEVDKVNQPDRAIASGRISLQRAKALSIPFLAIGLVSSALLGMFNFAIAAVFALIGWYYNYRAKKLGLGGNSLVALSLAIPYIFGSVAVGNYSVNLSYLLALTSFLAGMGREVLKGICDVEGDKIRKVKTVAASRGVKVASVVSASFFVLAIASSALPILFGILGKALYIYLPLILVPDILFGYLAFKTRNISKTSEALRLKSYALIGMMLGLLVYLVAGLAG